MAHRLDEGGFFVSDDPALIDVRVVHGFLETAYWCRGIPLAVVERAIANSMVFGVYKVGGVQVGFCRVVSDKATFAYLADVFVLPEWRGRGLSKLMMRGVVTHPELLNLRRWLLLTRDAHGLYRQFGFAGCSTPERVMERVIPNAYLSPKSVVYLQVQPGEGSNR
jgi:GNAT superfamily N-acetyltransferase